MKIEMPKRLPKRSMHPDIRRLRRQMEKKRKSDAKRKRKKPQLWVITLPYKEYHSVRKIWTESREKKEGLAFFDFCDLLLANLAKSKTGKPAVIKHAELHPWTTEVAPSTSGRRKIFNRIPGKEKVRIRVTADRYGLTRAQFVHSFFCLVASDPEFAYGLLDG